jgi:HK97 gp10 family phage protein
MIEIEGIEEVMRELKKNADPEKLYKQMGKACAVVERAATDKAPKGNGDLQRSIQFRVEVNGDEIVGIVFTPLEYAPYVEYGTGLFAEEGGRKDVPWHYKDDKGEWHSTSGQHPKPFMRPALNESREQVIRILKEALAK